MKTLTKTLLCASALMLISAPAPAHEGWDHCTPDRTSYRDYDRNDHRTRWDDTRWDRRDRMHNDYALTRSDVRSVQLSLRDRGYNIAADGIWGPRTEGALRDFQSRNRLRATGEVDARTLDMLNVVLTSNANTRTRTYYNR